jgi:quercetin dioxygenase-like cupin family protein
MPTQNETVNQPVVVLSEILARNKTNHRWSEKLILDGRNRAALISSAAGVPSDPHLHPDFNEWWIGMDGRTSWQIGEYGPVVAEFGDIVIAPSGARHDINAVGEGHGTRLVVGPEDSNKDLKGIEPARMITVDDALEPPNRIHTGLEYMFNRHSRDEAWSEEVLLDQRNRINMIHTLPGQASSAHWHPDMAEWWFVAKGDLEWKVGDRDPFRATWGDIVYVESGIAHQITTVGDDSSVRYAVTTPDVIHHFLDDPEAPRPPKS